MDQVCNFCLGGGVSNLIALNDQELTMQIGRIFYFEVTPPPLSSGLICETCITIIEEFYQYAEQVARNQKLLRGRQHEAAAHLKTEPGELEDVDDLDDTAENIARDDFSITNEEESITSMEAGQWSGREAQQTQSPERADREQPVESVDLKTERTDVSDKHTVGVKVNSENNDDESNLSPERLVLQQYKLSCDLCSAPLTDFADLRKHFKQAHNVSGYLRCCNRTIYKKCWMIEHLQLHLNPDAFRCAQCAKSYSSSKVLKEHQKEVHAPEADRAFHCTTCGKAFVSQAHLNAHIMVAHGSVRCPQCDKVLASQGSLRKHLVAVHGDGEKHVCDVCARVFRSKQSFEMHRQNHEGRRMEGKAQCELCAVWLTDKYCLRKHMHRMHSGSEEPIACGTCGKTVASQSALKSHIRRAHGESRFECERCAKTFKRPHHMREHMAIYHTGEELYGCLYCAERFNTKNKQYSHRKTAHPREYEEELRKRKMKE
uniref:C2H2-type domain-containing protein n=1 Tax=Anopheles dirus TaxID=7168 RepID=A0A182NIP2_9DIPT